METHIQDFANGSNFSSSWELQVRGEKMPKPILKAIWRISGCL